jgi:hypothetical protein
MVKKAVVKEKVKEQISLFDTMESYQGDFVIDNCKLSKSVKIWCKNWDGKGDTGKVRTELKCPKGITEENVDKCKFYVAGTPCKNFRDKK